MVVDSIRPTNFIKYLNILQINQRTLWDSNTALQCNDGILQRLTIINNCSPARRQACSARDVFWRHGCSSYVCYVTVNLQFKYWAGFAKIKWIFMSVMIWDWRQGSCKKRGAHQSVNNASIVKQWAIRAAHPSKCRPRWDFRPICPHSTKPITAQACQQNLNLWRLVL